jgi:hypothetical protein
MDAARWYAMKELGDTRFDALAEYQASPRFTETERAALDYATELTNEKKVSRRDVRAPQAPPHRSGNLRHRLARREQHLYNISNIGLNIGSDGLLQIERAGRSGAEDRRRGAEQPERGYL